ncbi:DUF4838 domain-containing protein [Eubacteriales bacterium mix99]
MTIVEEKAKEVLAKYLYQMTGQSGHIRFVINPHAFAVADPKLDDAYRVAVHHGKGTIQASNARSLLLAVYHLLRSCGCSFVRPGEANERVPQCSLEDITASLDVVAGYRYRGICVEGSCNLEDTLGLLEWMPKVGMNSYFMQFREGYQFFERWYRNGSNPARQPWHFDLTIERTILPRIIACVRENGLSYQGAGHGFTCECFGVPGLGWMEMDDWPEEYQYALAMRNGVRNMSYQVPLISALCYSNEEVQEKVVDSAVDYIAAHPEMDVVHFWLDDGNNNKCECENCKDTRIADFYVEMLNRLDAGLTARGLDVRIVFLAYHETLWPPQRNRLHHPERFIFMFAPIQRSFRQSFPDIASAGKMKPYCMNDQPFPKTNLEAVSHLKAWNQYLKGNHFDLRNTFEFDYYLNNFGDCGQFVQARIIYEDVHRLKQNGLNGIVNCQMQRLFGHAALPMYVLAAALLEPERSFEAIVDEFFEGAFGRDFSKMRTYWQELTDSSAFMREDQHASKKEVNDFSQLLEARPAIACEDFVTASCLRSFDVQLKIYRGLNELEKAAMEGNQTILGKRSGQLLVFIAAYENECSLDYDLYYVRQYLAKRFGYK